MLDILIWQIADVDAQAGACITAQISGTYGRFRAVIALLTFHQQLTNKDLKGLIGKATELSQKANAPGEGRHRTVHDPWYEYPYSADQTAQFRAMPHKDPKYGIQAIDLNEIKTNLDDIKKFAERVKTFRDDVLADARNIVLKMSITILRTLPSSGSMRGDRHAISAPASIISGVISTSSSSARDHFPTPP